MPLPVASLTESSARGDKCVMECYKDEIKD